MNEAMIKHEYVHVSNAAWLHGKSYSSQPSNELAIGPTSNSVGST